MKGDTLGKIVFLIPKQRSRVRLAVSTCQNLNLSWRPAELANTLKQHSLEKKLLIHLQIES